MSFSLCSKSVSGLTSELIMHFGYAGDGEVNEEEFYRIMKKTSLF